MEWVVRAGRAKTYEMWQERSRSGRARPFIIEKNPNEELQNKLGFQAECEEVITEEDVGGMISGETRRGSGRCDGTKRVSGTKTPPSHGGTQQGVGFP